MTDEYSDTIREKLKQDTSSKLNSLNNIDVDWFLRSVSLSDYNSDLALKESSQSISEERPSLAGNLSNLGSQNTIKQDSNVNTLNNSLNNSSETINNPRTNNTDNHFHRTRSNSVSANTLRKTVTTPSISSVYDPKPVPEKQQGGIFSRIKNKFKKEKPSSAPLVKTNSNNLSRSNSRTGSLSRTTSRNDFKLDTYEDSRFKNKLSRSISTPVPNAKGVDPRLEEYINFYKNQNLKVKRLSVSSPIDHHSASNINLNTTKASEPIKLDCAGKPIPAHPKCSPLPSALINKRTYESAYEHQLDQQDQQDQQQKSVLSFLSRKKTNVENNSLSRVASMVSDTSINSIPSPLQSPIQSPIPEENLPDVDIYPPLKVVAFHSSVFAIDPPQQIPSRSPRKGNVEVLKNGGGVIIHPLTEEEKLEHLRHVGGGVVVGGTGNLRVVVPQTESNGSNPSTESQSPISKSDDKEHNEKVDPDEVNVNKTASNIGIDKPMVSRHNHSSNSEEIVHENLTMDLLYTRCCHLREILPIPSTLKQIPANSMGPLPILQLRNPRPSLIEILTFADFVRIAPIACVSLDGVSLSPEMFRILLSSLQNVQKLSLRNTPIDSEGWKLLCWFLSTTQRLNRLDITQCASLSVNIQKPKKGNSVARMECNKDNRTEMDWSLFTATIVARGGIEEMILSGCKIPFDQFEQFMELAASIRTANLGLAYNELTAKHMKLVAKWTSLNTSVGIDLGYNDLSEALQPFIDLSLTNYISNLSFISLNSTNLSFGDTFIKFISGFVNVPSLKYLDLSNNKKLFPKILPILISYIPSFPGLKRVLLDDNDLSTESLVRICEMLPQCTGLHSISLVGNKFDETAARAISEALKVSKSLYVIDLDIDNLPSHYKQEIGLYTMRNMEYVLYGRDNISNTDESLTDQLTKLLANNGEDLDYSSDEFQRFMSKLKSLRAEILEATSDLFKLQQRGELNTEGKETLIRLCFLDSSMERGLDLVDKHAHRPHNHVAKAITRSIRSENMVVREDGASPLSSEESVEEDAQELKFEDEAAISRSSSKTALNKLDKEEGSVLKLSKMNLHKNHSFQDLKHMSGEGIREKLSNTKDLGKIVDYLQKLREEGIPLEKIYHKDESNCLKLESLKNLRYIAKEGKSSDSKGNSRATEGSRDESSSIDKSSFSEDDNDGDDDDISINSDFSDDEADNAYDRLLKDIVKVKTKDV